MPREALIEEAIDARDFRQALQEFTSAWKAYKARLLVFGASDFRTLEAFKVLNAAETIATALLKRERADAVS